MDTPEKRKAYAVYQFYRDCYGNDDKVLSDTDPASPLLTCHTAQKADDDLLSVDMALKEAVPYESLDRVEISVRNSRGKEFFRAMVNRTSRCTPIPPNAFGLYPVGEKNNLELKDVKSAGMEAQVPVTFRYGYLLPGCKTSWDRGLLTIHWRIHAFGWQSPDGRFQVLVKIVSSKEKHAQWQPCSVFPYAASGDMQDDAAQKTARVKPEICLKKKHCFSPDSITLVHLLKHKRQGVLQRWPGDTTYTYSYTEHSREVIDLKKLPGREISLSTGFYQFIYNDVRGDPPAGYYGKSRIFKIGSNESKKIPVWVKPAL